MTPPAAPPAGPAPARPVLPRWTPPEAALASAAASLAGRLAFAAPGGPAGAALAPLDSAPGPAPAVVVRLSCGPRSALAGLGSKAIAAAHPAAAGLDPERLPAGLIAALAGDLVRPLLDRLSGVLGGEVALGGALAGQAAADAWPSSGRVLRFTLDFGGPASAVTETVALAPASDDDRLWLVGRLAGLARPRRLDLGPLALPAAVVAGGVPLPAADVAALGPGDLLIPDDPPIRPGLARLEVPGLPPFWLALEPGRAVVAASGPKEASVNDKTPPPGGAGQPKGPEAAKAPEAPEAPKASGAPEAAPLALPGDLELPLRFEIGRLAMTLRELEALAPGAALAFESDPLRPVSVTCHGQTLARGMLVDLGDGRLGVQLAEVGGPARAPAPAPGPTASAPAVPAGPKGVDRA